MLILSSIKSVSWNSPICIWHPDSGEQCMVWVYDRWSLEKNVKHISSIFMRILLSLKMWTSVSNFHNEIWHFYGKWRETWEVSMDEITIKKIAVRSCTLIDWEHTIFFVDCIWFSKNRHHKWNLLRLVWKLLCSWIDIDISGNKMVHFSRNG